MITTDNLKFCFENLNKEEVKKAFKSDKDYIKFELHIFNAGGFSTVKAKNFSEKKYKKAINCGNLFLSKNDFLGLFLESGAKNKHIKKYL